jgi:hypothetical protein
MESELEWKPNYKYPMTNQEVFSVQFSVFRTAISAPLKTESLKTENLLLILPRQRYRLCHRMRPAVRHA